MFNFEDKENQIPPYLDIHFKKKQKAKPKTDRTTTTLSNSNLRSPNLPESHNSSTISLIQKKKQYAQNIRAKHLNSNKKMKQQYYNEAAELASSNIQMGYASIQDNSQSTVQRIKIKSTVCHKYEPGENINIKIYNSKGSTREKIKNKKINANIDQIKTYTDININKIDKQNRKDHQVKKQLKQSNYTNKKRQPTNIVIKHDIDCQTKKTLWFSPLEINYTIQPFFTEQMREIEILHKQNGTYKKQIASYRKEAGSLKRQIDLFKKKIDELQEKNNFLINQNQDQIQLLESFQLKVTGSFDYEEGFQGKKVNLTKTSGERIEGWEEIVKNYETELFQSASKIKQLQFKNYMLEKKLLDESQYHRKVMAKQVSNWKQRYIRARNQNMRLKDSRNSTLFEMSFSTEM